MKMILGLSCLLAAGFLQAASSPIHEAAKKGDLDTIKKLVEQAQFIETQKGITKWKGLSIWLVDLRDSKNNTPLHYAAEKGRENVVKYLKDKGADLTKKGEKRKTASELAKTQKLKGMLRPAAARMGAIHF